MKFPQTTLEPPRLTSISTDPVVTAQDLPLAAPARPPAPALILAGDPVVYYACQLDLGGRPVIAWLLESLARARIFEVELMLPPGDIDLGESLPAHTPRGLIVRATRQGAPGALAGLAEAAIRPGETGLIVFEANRLFHDQVFARLSADRRANVLLGDFAARAAGAACFEVDADNLVLNYGAAVNPLRASGASLGILRLCAEAFDAAQERARLNLLHRMPDFFEWLIAEHAVHALASGGLPRLRVRGHGDLEEGRRWLGLIPASGSQING